jgi:hypothetical protein
MEDDRKTAEVFLPCTLGAHKARDHAYSTIRVSASEAGEFVDQIRIGAGIREADGWCKWSAHYLPAPPGVPRTSGRIDRVGRTNGRHHHPRRFSGASDGQVVTLEFEGTSAGRGHLDGPPLRQVPVTYPY